VRHAGGRACPALGIALSAAFPSLRGQSRRCLSPHARAKQLKCCHRGGTRTRTPSVAATAPVAGRPCFATAGWAGQFLGSAAHRRIAPGEAKKTMSSRSPFSSSRRGSRRGRRPPRPLPPETRSPDRDPGHGRDREQRREREQPWSESPADVPPALAEAARSLPRRDPVGTAQRGSRSQQRSLDHVHVRGLRQEAPRRDPGSRCPLSGLKGRAGAGPALCELPRLRGG
jgi:hypothetical protein